MTGSIFNRVKEASSDGGLHLTHYKQQYLALAWYLIKNYVEVLKAGARNVRGIVATLELQLCVPRI